MPATITATDIKRLTKPELVELDTPEARAELDRRKGRRQEKGKAWHENADREIARAISDVLDLFDSGALPEKVAITYIRRQESDAPSSSWSLLNQLTMLLNGTADARGRKQWEKAGRTVIAGAQPFYILGPKMRTFKVEDEETGEETTRRVMRGFVGIAVYAVEDTEGDPIVAADYTPATLPPLFDVAEKLGVAVSWTHFSRDYRGFYQPGADAITLMTHDEKTFLHELAHAAHNRVIQARGGKGLKGGQDPSQEIVAETVAAVLCKLLGLDGYLYDGRQYLLAYAEKSGRDLRTAIARVLGDVQACLDLLVEVAAGEEVS